MQPSVGRGVLRDSRGDTPGREKQQHLSPACAEAGEHQSKGKKIFSRVNKLFKSPRKHHRKLSESRSEDGASSDTEELERSSETPVGCQARVQVPHHFSPEPVRRRMTATASSPAPLLTECSPLVSVESDPSLPQLAKPPAVAAAAVEAATGTPQHQRPDERWDRAAIDVEASHELLQALREKMSALDEDIQTEMGQGASTLKDFLATLDNSDVTEKSRQNARKTFERCNRSRSKKLLQLQTRLEQLMQVMLEVQKSGVPKGREPEEYAKSLMKFLTSHSAAKKKSGVLDTVKQVGQRLEGAVDNMKGAAGSIGRSLKRPGRSSSLDNLVLTANKDGQSDDGDASGFHNAATLPRVSGPPTAQSPPSEPSEPAQPSAPGNLSVVGSRQSGGGPETAKTASSSGGGAGGVANGGGATTGSSRERRSTSECSQSNSSVREEVAALRSVVDDLRQQMENNNYAVEVNRRDLGRNADFYRMGLEETNAKMERLEELFNESINTLKEEMSALGEQLEYRFIDRHRNLRDSVESLRNQQSQIERRYEQHFRGGLDTGEAYAPSLLKTRLLDLLIAVFNLLVFLLSALFQLGIRLANIGSHLQRRPAVVLSLVAGLLLLLLGGLVCREAGVLRWLSSRMSPLLV